MLNEDQSVRRLTTALDSVVVLTCRSIENITEISFCLVLVVALLAVPSRVLAQDAGEPPADEAQSGVTDTEAAEPEETGPPLPKDFTPKAQAPEVMLIENELLTDDEEKAFNRMIPSYNRALKSSSYNDDDRKMIEDGIRWRIHKFSMAKYRKPHLNELGHDYVDLRKAVLRDVGYARPGANREFVLSQILERCKELLDGNFYVRLNALILLSELNTKDPDRQRNIPPEVYTDPLDTVLAVFTDDSQIDPIKLRAALGLRQILLYGAPSIAKRIEIASAINKELDRSGLHHWYQMRLTETLGDVGVLGERGEPFVVQRLATLIADTTRHWQVRSEASLSMGRLPLDSSINVNLIAYQIAKLSLQMAMSYNKNRRPFFWQDCFVKVYMSFDGKIDGQEFGLLDQAGGNRVVQGAYGQIRPLVNHLVVAPRGTPFPNDILTDLDGWIKSNEPDSYSVAQGQPPIAQETSSGSSSN